ncbi:transcriptional regulator, partial [Lacticaseibacillus rhamnosus]|uniref:transcriptional regulator n=1 Tax=Lacticaseibacillus rhamnosus TaxID=47715 RepID=UPI002554D0AF
YQFPSLPTEPAKHIKLTIKSSLNGQSQQPSSVLTSLIMTGVAATTFLGFFPHWLAQVIWSIYAIVLLIWSRASDPKSTDIFASWSITSRLLIATFFSLMGLIFCLTALYLIWFRGIDVQIVLVLIGGAGLLILTKPVWPHRQHAK